jgi:hypothetical protein
MARSAGVPQRLRNDGKSNLQQISTSSTPLTISESWVEISSQPSSSSLSSIGEEIVTTGLRVDPNSRRRRRIQPGAPSRIGLEARQTSTSSQEEYEESESEEDHLLTSSNEHILPATQLPATIYSSDSDDDDDDENSTALGRRTADVFTPQPNAFSHPPSSRAPVPGSYFPSSSTAPQNPNPYVSNKRQPTDHDAALRASLTTLLSIGAAAAKGKRAATNPATTNAEPMGLRLVPESELTGTVQPNISHPLSPSTRARSSPSISSQEAIEKGKRKAAASGEKTKRRKKVAVSEVNEDSTLFTWVLSAGVLVLVSVVGFGAGYVIGREVGRHEVSGFGISDGGSCGREVVKGGSGGSLRRFKWGISGGGGARSVVA